MDLSDEELLLSSDKTWEKILIDIDQNKIFQTNIDTDVNDLPDAKHLEVLFQKFGHKNFRPLQWKIIKSILTHKRDNCAIMATGYGKSLCYQFPAVYSEGIAIVISPLISLMEDQVLSLTKKNISSCLLGSAQTNQNINDEILENKYSIIYLTPKFCTYDCGINLLKTMHSQLRITLIAVDEAHCVSSSGHDFRRSYRELGILKDIFFDVPILALTATATEPVKKDIVNSLKLKDPQVLCSGYDRPNLYFSVRPKSGNIYEDLKSLMICKDGRWVFDGSTIIYCITQNDTEKIYELLQSFEIASTMYHAGMSLKERSKAHENFVKDKVPVIVATSVFGIGIDKSDIRNIIHYGTSNSIEAYYQEVGRAGRDGLSAKCVTLYSVYDLSMHSHLMQDSNNMKERFQLLNMMNEYLMINKCRRRFILSYFTGRVDLKLSQKLECCDNCSPENSIYNDGRYEGLINQGMYDFTNNAVTFLTAVNVMNGDFGVDKYIYFLMGSKCYGVFKRFKYHPCYGSGARKSVDWWKAIATFLQLHMYLTINPRKMLGFSFFATRITDKGLTFLQQPYKKLIEKPTVDIWKCLKKDTCYSDGSISADASCSSSNTTKSSITSRKTSRLSISNILRDHPMEKLRRKDTALISYSYFENGLTLHEIASKRNMTFNTVHSHLLVAMKIGYPIRMEQLEINLVVFTAIMEAINSLDGQYSSARSIMKACSLGVTYQQIGVVSTYLEIRMHLKKIGKAYEEFEILVSKEHDPILNDINNHAIDDDDDDYDDNLTALIKALQDAAADKSDPNILNQIDDSNYLKNTLSSDTSVYSDFEPPSKKIKT